MLINNPVFVELDSGQTGSDVVNQLIEPHIIETINKNDNTAYVVSDSSLVSKSYGGYDNSKEGIYYFKVEAKGDVTKLQTERVVKVVVASSIPTDSTFATIDGKDITIAQNSEYDNNKSLYLHANKYNVVSTELIAITGVTSEALTVDNIENGNVNVGEVGTYRITYVYNDANKGVEAVNSFVVDVKNSSTVNAHLTANDSDVKLENAPKTEKQILGLLSATAFDSSVDISQNIRVIDYNNYNLASPALGSYEFTLAVSGSDGVVVTTNATLNVKDNSATLNSIKLLVNDPVFIEKGNGKTAANVIDEYVTPYVIETIGSKDNPAYLVSDANLVAKSYGGYDNSKDGEYYFKIEVEGTTSKLRVERYVKVIVANSLPSTKTIVSIDGKDAKILVGSNYNAINSLVLHANEYRLVSAVMQTGQEFDNELLSSSNVLNMNVTTSAKGIYKITYSYVDTEKSLEAVRQFNVIVGDPDASNALIIATDTEIGISDAPKTVSDLNEYLNVMAVDGDGSDLTAKVKIDNYGGYDLNNPQIGSFDIEYSVVGNDGVNVTTSAVLKVKADTDDTNLILMMVNDPVYVKLGNGMTGANVVDTLITPHVFENENSAYIVDEYVTRTYGGYDNNKAGTYYFKLEVKGKTTGLNAERFVRVIVGDDYPSAQAVGDIDGKDITILQNSTYDFSNVLSVHGNNYDVVSAVITKGDVETVKSLTESHIVSSSVNPGVAGEYLTTFVYFDFDEKVEAIKSYNVTVVEPSADNAIITASDYQINLASAPSNEKVLGMFMNVEAIESDGTNITSKVKITSLGGYRPTKPVVGDYVIEYAVVGGDGVTITTRAMLSVKSNQDSVDSVKLLVNDPVYVLKGNGMTAENVIDSLVKPHLVETIGGTSRAAAVLSSSDLTFKSFGGYDNNKESTYYFKVEATGSESGLSVERFVKIVVAAEMPDDVEFAKIDGKNIVVLSGSDYDELSSLILHANNYDLVSAVVTKGTTSTNTDLNTSNIESMFVNTATEGDYKITYSYQSSSGYEAVETFVVNVTSTSKSNAVLTASDYETSLSNAPTTADSLMTVLKVKAIDSDGVDLTDNVKLVDLGGYDLTAPKQGKYIVSLAVTGGDGVTVRTSAVLNIKSNTATINTAEMFVNTPVFVTTGNGLSGDDVINTLIKPHIIETNGETIRPAYTVNADGLTSKFYDGYDNNVAGTYFFKLEAKGGFTNLQLERYVKVIVADSIPEGVTTGKIDTKDVTVLVGSEYNNEVSLKLHANNYDVVSVETLLSGVTSNTALTSDNVLSYTVNTKVANSYKVTYKYRDDNNGLEIVETFGVEVVKSSHTNAVLTAADKELNLGDAPKTKQALFDALSVNALDEGDDITASVIIFDSSDYNFETPAVGKYEFEFIVTGKDGAVVSTKATLTVKANGETTNSIQMYVNNPVYVKLNDETTGDAVINDLIVPHLVETINGVPNAVDKIGDDELVYKSYGGYDNSRAGTYYFKLEAKGEATGLQVERYVKVIVADSIPADETIVKIDGRNIKILVDTPYDNVKSIKLHADNYADVSAVAYTGTQPASVSSLTTSNVLSQNVDTSVAKTYDITYLYIDDTKGVEAVRTLNVVVADADSLIASITATDKEVEKSNSPTTDAGIIAALEARALDGDGTDLTDKIEVIDYGTYNLAAPDVGTYEVTLKVKGNDGVGVTTTAKLNVKADGSKLNSIDVLVNDPVYVELNDGSTAQQVVDNFIKPHIIETVADVKKPAYIVSSSDLDSLKIGGYDNSKTGTYYFKIEATGTETSLQVEHVIKVIVSDELSDADTIANIDAKDIKVLVSSEYDVTKSLGLHANKYDVVSVEITSGEAVVEEELDESNFVSTTVNTSTEGKYKTVYSYQNSVKHVEAVKTVEVEVVKQNSTNAVITASDAEVAISDAPEDIGSLTTLLKVSAVDDDDTDLTKDINVVSYGGYDFDDIKVGSFDIMFAVEGNDGTTVTTMAKLSVKNDTDPFNSIKMLVNTPVFVEIDNGLSADGVVDTLIKPHVVETIDGVDSQAMLVASNGLVAKYTDGYDNSKAGTYYFKLTAKGATSKLEVERYVKVIVASEFPDTEAMVNIDAKSITLLKDSDYDTFKSVVLHANNFDLVTAVITNEGQKLNVSLNRSNVLSTNVNTSILDDYKTTFNYVNETLGIEAVETYNVAVKDASKTNAAISATDNEVLLKNSPTNLDDLLSTLSVEAIDGDGTDLKAKVIVLDYDDYDYESLAVGSYTFKLAVTGSDGVTVTTTAVLNVKNNNSKLSSIELYVNNPVFVELGDGSSADDVINNGIKPHVLETVLGNVEEIYGVSASELIVKDDGGYDNDVKGTYYFKIEVKGVQTKLNAERVVTVVVDDSRPSDVNVATIDGKDIKVLLNSEYDNQSSLVLHADNYETVTSVVTTGTKKSEVKLAADNVMNSTVNTSTASSYKTTYVYIDNEKDVEAVETFDVVVEDVSKSNAIITASDTQVKLQDAPTTKSSILNTLDVFAIDSDGADLTSSVKIVDLDGYNMSNPATGSYTIVFAVVGGDGVTVTTAAELKIVSNTSTLDDLELYLNNPVFVEKGNGMTGSRVVDELVKVHALETVAGQVMDAYVVSDSRLKYKSYGEYDNNTAGTYYFKVEVEGVKTGLQEERYIKVIVGDSLLEGETVAVIDAKDISTLVGSKYNNEISVVLHANKYSVVSAEITTKDNVTNNPLNGTSVLSSSVNTKVPGKYLVTYFYKNNDVEAVGTYNVNVSSTNKDNTTLTATDAEVNLKDAPTTQAQLLNILNVNAVDNMGVSLTSSVKAIDLGGYDYANAEVGSYNIKLAVTGTDSVIVTTDVKLVVKEDGKALNSVTMLVNNPVYVNLDNGMSGERVIDELIKPHLVETVGTETNDAVVVSASDLALKTYGGYDNSIAGTYYFKLEATGEKTGLNVERYVKVVVAEDLPSDLTVAEIDAKDITVLVDSKYDAATSLVLHANNYDVVSAVLTTGGTPTSTALIEDNVLSYNVDTTKEATYKVTYNYVNATSGIEAVDTFNVTVKKPTDSNAILSAIDTEVKISNAPTTNQLIVQTLKATSVDSDGTDLTSKISVVDYGDYDLSAPQTGSYQIVLSVVGGDGVTITTSATLKVVDDNVDLNTVDMYVNNPVFVKLNNEMSADDVINMLIKPHIVENGLSAVLLSSDDLTSKTFGGYDNTKASTYYFKLEALGSETKLSVDKIVKVVVADEMPKDVATAAIDGKDISLLIGSEYDNNKSLVLHANNSKYVSVNLTTNGSVTSQFLTVNNIVDLNVDTSKKGNNTIVFRYADSTSGVEAVETFNVNVVEPKQTNANLTATDKEVNLSSAPKTDAEVVSILSGYAVDYDNSDLTDEIVVVDMGTYDMTTPAVGSYDVVLAVTGKDGVTVTTRAKLVVKADVDSLNSVKMLVNDPVFVKFGSYAKAEEVVDKVIQPHVLETIAGEDNSPYTVQVSDLESATYGGYNADTVGVYYFKLEAKGKDSDLNVERVVKVIVENELPEDETVGNIDGKDISILQGSTYTTDLSVKLHADNYLVVCAEIWTGNDKVDVPLTSSNVQKYSVDTNTSGKYGVTYSYVDEVNNVETVRTLKVDVRDNVTPSATITATDVEVNLTEAPKSDKELISILSANAVDSSGESLTSKINVVDLAGYNKNEPEVGFYDIMLSVVGDDGITVTTTARITVKADNESLNAIRLLVNDPVFVKLDNGMTGSDVIDKLIKPHVIETIANIDNLAYVVSAGDLVVKNYGGYDNSVENVYYFKVEAQGKETLLQTERYIKVIVANDLPSDSTVANIDGKDIKVLVNTEFDEAISLVLNANNYSKVSAEVTTGDKVSPTSLVEENIVSMNVDTKVEDTYQVTYSYSNQDNSVNAVETFNVEVVEPSDTNAILFASDAQTKLSLAPTSESEVLSLIKATALESNGVDISRGINLVSDSDYDYNTPKVGEYRIVVSVVGNDGITVTEEAMLKVESDVNFVSKSVDILVNSPVYVEANNGMSAGDVVNQLVKAHAVETVDGVVVRPYVLDDASLVSNGGYDNSVDGMYIFKLTTVGVNTNMKVSDTVIVYVSSDVTTVSSYVEMDGKDIKLLEGSYYSNSLASRLHSNNSDEVTMTVYRNGSESVIPMNESNIIYSDTNTKNVSTYTTVFTHTTGLTRANTSNAQGVVSYTVEIVAKSAQTSAIVSATDTEVNQSNAPKTLDDILTTIKASAVNPNGTTIMLDGSNVVSIGNYDLDNPQLGSYEVVLSVTGADGVDVVKTVKLVIVEDEKTLNKVVMSLNTPVYIELNNGYSIDDVVEKSITPYVNEVYNGTTSSVIALTRDNVVSTSGYNNSVEGTYVFEVEYTGEKTGLTARRYAKVIVTSNPSTINVYGSIDGKDVKLMQEDNYYPLTTHANNYETVKVIVNNLGQELVLATTVDNIRYSNVNVNKQGTYQTLVSYVDSTTYGELVEVSKLLNVEVVDMETAATLIDVEKSVYDSSENNLAESNEVLSYTVVVRNRDDMLTLNNASLSDMLSNKNLSINNVSNIMVFNGDNEDVTDELVVTTSNGIVVELDTLNPGDAYTLKFDVKLNAVENSQEIDNTAILRANGFVKNSNKVVIETPKDDTLVETGKQMFNISLLLLFLLLLVLVRKLSRR